MNSGQPNSDPSNTRPIIGAIRFLVGAIVAPIVVIVLGTIIVGRIENCTLWTSRPECQHIPIDQTTTPTQRSAPSAPVEITLLSSDTKEDWINTVTESFNAGQYTLASGRPVSVAVSHGTSGGTQEDILWDGVQPTIWSPGDQSWVDGANQHWTDLHGRPLVSETCTPTVYAPIGFGMWRPMAEALGWPEAPISWETIVSLAADTEGWGRYGHPEWGQFKFGHTHPDHSNSGLLIMTALAYDTLGQTDGLTPELVKSQPVVDAMRNVELHTFHYGKQSKNLAMLMVRKGPSYLHAINITEAEVLRNNALYADDMDFPLAFIFPSKGAFWAEQPFCILDAEWVTDEQKEAAELYRQYLLAPEQQVLAIEHNLRPVDQSIPLGDPFTLANGTDPSVTPDTVHALASPSGAVSAAVKDVFHQVKKKATVILVLDTSSSMATENKIKDATEATANFLDRLERDDEIIVFTFGDEVNQLQPSGRAGDVVDQLSQTVQTLFADGSTRLYDAICAAASDMVELQVSDQSDGEQRLYGIVVLSDGDDTVSEKTESDMYNCLPSGEDVEGIKVFTIAYGEEANEVLLTKIANRTNGGSFAGDPDTIEDVYVAISAEQ